MSSVADVYLGISQKYSEQKNLPINPYLKTIHISLKSTSGQVLLMRQHSEKKKIGESKPSSKLTLRTKRKWYHSCGCCDDSQSCIQLKKHVTHKYFEKS